MWLEREIAAVMNTERIFSIQVHTVPRLFNPATLVPLKYAGLKKVLDKQIFIQGIGVYVASRVLVYQRLY